MTNFERRTPLPEVIDPAQVLLHSPTSRTLPLMSDYPTPWQRKMIWAAVTAFCVVLLVVIVGTVIWTGANILSFLQPILIPVAIAGILTYLLDPLVTKMSRGDAQSHQSGDPPFCDRLFCTGWIARLAYPNYLNPERKFRETSPCLHRKSARSHCRSYLSIRSNVRSIWRSTRKVCIDQPHKLAHRS